jgi:hypothetical protein
VAHHHDRQRVRSLPVCEAGARAPVTQHSPEAALPGSQRGQEPMVRPPGPKPNANAHGSATVLESSVAA